MEYYRTENGQIQADLARRLGLALRQYREQRRGKEQDYSVTLSLSVLHTLLTSCVQLAKNLASKKRIKSFLSEPLGDSLPNSNEPIVFQKAIPRRPKTYFDLLNNLRDSMSHPNPIDGSSGNTPTGFTSIQDGSGALKCIRFVWAPNIDNGGWPRGFKSKEEADELACECRDEDPARSNQIKVVKEDRFWYVRDSEQNELISRVVVVDLSSNQVYSLAIALCIILAQPLNKDWDQKTMTSLEKLIPNENAA